MKTIKYFFEFLVIVSLFLIFKVIGLKLSSIFGGILGRLVGPLIRSRSIFEKNINIAFEKIDQKNKNQIYNGMWSNIGSTFSEYIHLNKFRSPSKNLDLLKINGSMYLDNIKKKNKPVIFFSGHFANFELMAMEIDKYGIKLATVYRPLNNIFLNPIIEYLRMKFICPNQIPKGKSGTKEAIKKINNGYSLAIMMDQRISQGIKAKFFSQDAFTSVMPSQFALKYNCDLVPVYLERKNNNKFELTFYEPFAIEKTGNMDEDIKNGTLTINRILEKMIKKDPKQWIWSHNRWK